jgi:hypothetical protein
MRAPSPDAPRPAVIGVDIGTSSSKGVLVDLDGRLLASEAVEHTVERPGPGMFEMDGTVWWEEFVAIARALLGQQPDAVRAVGVSGMGPCVLLTDEAGEPPAGGDIRRIVAVGGGTQGGLGRSSSRTSPAARRRSVHSRSAPAMAQPSSPPSSSPPRRSRPGIPCKRP